MLTSATLKPFVNDGQEDPQDNTPYQHSDDGYGNHSLVGPQSTLFAFHMNQEREYNTRQRKKNLYPPPSLSYNQLYMGTSQVCNSTAQGVWGIPQIKEDLPPYKINVS